ncbi:hypothetical protein TDB9533_04026 [Thalassocella blandensis]|nr:hypothetical protein TDB9533_04026 [Thalassocella blandensis]
MFLIEEPRSGARYAYFDQADKSTGMCRWLAGLVPSAVVTLALIAVMHSLVSVEFEEPPEDNAVVIEPVYFEEVVIETRIERKPQQPEKPLDPPPVPQSDPEASNEQKVNIQPLSFKESEFKIKGISGMSSMPVAAYLVSAKYPPAALRRGLEGYVDVTFDVNEAGITQNMRVVGAMPEGVFDKSALEAVSRWRYKPKMVDGRAEYFTGLTKRIRFQLDKS